MPRQSNRPAHHARIAICAASLFALLAATAPSLAQHPTAACYVPPKLIDFSRLHDVLIRSDDGTLTPADEPHYRSRVIAPGVWQIESQGDYHYLIEGNVRDRAPQ